jgi:hypothetical protein
MNAVAAYFIVKAQEAGRKQGSEYPENDPMNESPKPRPGLGARVRRMFRPRPRVVREPGFAATHSMLSEFVPQLRAYPYPPIYR